MAKVVTRDSWKTCEPPHLREGLRVQHSYSLEEFDQLKLGFEPQAMEDRWFVYFESPWLYFHRSWTGHCIYRVRFELDQGKATAVEAWVSRDSEQYRGTNSSYDGELLQFLISSLLLKRSVEFPLLQQASNLPHGVQQHAVSGTVHPERPSSTVKNE